MTSMFLKCRAAAAWVAAAALLVLGGCSSPSPRYYSLSARMSPPAGQQAAAGSPLAIEVAPIAMPERLMRPQMVVRSAQGGAEVDILEFHRWSSSFEDELRDALASGVAARLGALDATRAGSPAGVPVVRVAVQLRRFDATPGGTVAADLGWTARRLDEGRPLTCQAALSEPVGMAMESVADGAQRLTAALASRIADSIANQRCDG